MSKKNPILIIVLLVAVFMVLNRFADFVVSHTPPFKVGECAYSPKNIFVKIKIDENDLVRGSSLVSMYAYKYLVDQDYVPFSELRSLKLDKVECNE